MSYSPYIELKNVSLSFDESRPNALNNISLSISKGQRICILGANGSGKSTLAQVLSGMLAPDFGEVTLCDTLVYSDRTGAIGENYKKIRPEIGYVFQDAQDQIITNIVKSDIAFGPENLGLCPQKITERVEEALKLTHLEEYRDQDPTYLSGGTQQKVAIASILCLKGNVFVADEPSAMLDIKGKKATLKLMEQMQNMSKTVIHITHFIDEALLADKIFVLDKGEIALSGTPEYIFSKTKKLSELGLELPFETQLKLYLKENTKVDKPSCSKEISSNKVVSIKNLDYSWGYSQTNTLHNINLDIYEKECLCIVGHTGSGKSTLAKTIAALNLPSKGSVEILGKDTSNKLNRASLRQELGFVMQKPERQLFAETVEKDVCYGPSNQGLSECEIEDRVNYALSALNINHLRDVSPFDLSEGQKRSVAIAGIIAMMPKILILDEPTSGLDPKSRQDLISLLKKLQESGTTLIIITHSMNLAADMADRICVLEKGSIKDIDSPKNIFKKKDMLESMGLGLPQALEWVVSHPYELGEPLSLEELANAIFEKGLARKVIDE